MSYYTYIMASRAKTLYIGVTNDIERRAFEHKAGLLRGFSARYNVNRLVYYGRLRLDQRRHRMREAA
jgi:putative endonuclease